MFGLGGDKKKQKEFEFDVEVEAKSPQKGRELKDYIINRTREVKNVLRSGEDQSNFDQYGVLLLGYTSLQKVITRVNTKKK